MWDSGRRAAPARRGSGRAARGERRCLRRWQRGGKQGEIEEKSARPERGLPCAGPARLQRSRRHSPDGPRHLPLGSGRPALGAEATGTLRPLRPPGASGSAGPSASGRACGAAAPPSGAAAAAAAAPGAAPRSRSRPRSRCRSPIPIPVAVPVPLPPLPPAKWSRSPRREDASGGGGAADPAGHAPLGRPLVGAREGSRAIGPFEPSRRAGPARWPRGEGGQRGPHAAERRPQIRHGLPGLPRPRRAPFRPFLLTNLVLPSPRARWNFPPFLRYFFGALRGLKARAADSPRGPGAVLEGKRGPGRGFRAVNFY